MGRYKVDQTTGALSLLAGRGKAEYGASTVRTGTVTLTAPEPNSSVLSYATVVFDTPMPDTDYIVELEISSAISTAIAVKSKTVNGFVVNIRNASVIASATIGTITISYTAFKLYTDTEYNEVLDRTDANSFGTVVDITSYNSDSNMYTCPSDGYLQLVATSGGTYQIQVRVVSATDSSKSFLISAMGAANALFVKKGIKLYVSYSSGTVSGYFIPLE